MNYKDNNIKTYTVSAADKARMVETDKTLYLSKLLIVLSVVFAWLNTFQGFLLIDAISKGIVALLCVSTFGLFIAKRQPHYALLILSLTAFIHVISFAFPVSPEEGIATYFMFAFWVLLWLGIYLNCDEIFTAATQISKFLLLSSVLWSVLVAIMLFLPMCYQTNWGEGEYFVAFSDSSFGITPVAFFMLGISILLYKINANKIQSLLLAIIPLACVFAAGSRTYLVVVLVQFILLLKLMVTNRKIFVLLIVCCFIGTMMLVEVTNIGVKMNSALLQTDDTEAFLRVLTNGRSEFWQIDFYAFLNSPPFEILFGHGFSFVYDLNQSEIGNRIYAHNDFINIVLNFGLVGLVLYFAPLIPALRALKGNRGIRLIFIFIWLFNAIFNSVYVYAVSVCCLGLMFVALAAHPKSDETDERNKLHAVFRPDRNML